MGRSTKVPIDDDRCVALLVMLLAAFAPDVNVSVAKSLHCAYEVAVDRMHLD